MEEVLAEQRPLDNQSAQQPVEAQSAIAVLLEEGHEKPETDEDHDVSIFIACEQK